MPGACDSGWLSAANVVNDAHNNTGITDILIKAFNPLSPNVSTRALPAL